MIVPVLSDSLLAPLLIARFALTYILIAVLPGYALATVLRPRAPRVERMALSIPCAYGLVALCGLATALAHIPFTPLTYSALALPVTLAGAYSRWRRRGTAAPSMAAPGVVMTVGTTVPGSAGVAPAPACRRRAGARGGRGDSRVNYAGEATERFRLWLWAPLGVALVQIGVIALVFAHSVVPSDVDSVSHVIWTNLIARSQTYPIALLSSHAGANDGGFYPPVFHALSALALAFVPMEPYRAVFYSVLAIVTVLPLTLFSFVQAATGSMRVAGLAVLASLAFEPLPFIALTQGLYPFIASLVIAPALALVIRDVLVQGDRRAAILAAILGVGLFYTHPTEFLTAALLTLILLSGAWSNVALWRRAITCGPAIAAVWGVTALPALAAVRRTMTGGAQPEIARRHWFASSPQIHPQNIVDNYLYWLYGLNLGYVLLAAVAAGLLWCLVRRRLLGLVAIQALLFALYFDTHTNNLLQRFYTLSFPWALTQRLIVAHYWFILPLAAIGIDLVSRTALRIGRARLPLFTRLAVSSLVVLGVLLPLFMTAKQTVVDVASQTYIAPQDVGALAWLARHAPAGATVVNDVQHLSSADIYIPLDAGLWMPVLSRPQPLFWRDSAGPGPLEDRLYLLAHVADAPLPPRARTYIARYQVRFVYYGAGLHRGGRRHLALPRLLHDPDLHLVYTSAASCRRARGRERLACPAGEAYVFALTSPGVVMAGNAGTVP